MRKHVDILLFVVGRGGGCISDSQSGTAKLLYGWSENFGGGF